MPKGILDYVRHGLFHDVGVKLNPLLKFLRYNYSIHNVLHDVLLSSALFNASDTGRHGRGVFRVSGYAAQAWLSSCRLTLAISSTSSCWQPFRIVFTVAEMVST